MTENRLRHWASRTSWWATPALVTVIAAVLVLCFSVAQAMHFSQWAIYILVALSLYLVWGHLGILSLAQTAFFGIAGYAYGVVAINFIGTTGESFTALLAAIIVGGAVAALLGYFMLYGRLSGLYLAITTYVFTLVVGTFFGGTADPSYHIGDAVIGGYNGMTGIPAVTFGIPGVFSTALDTKGTYVLAVLATGLVYIIIKLLMRSSFGRIGAAVRENELRCELLGYDVRLNKLLVFTLGGAIAGLAGGLYASWGYYISPAVFSVNQASLVLIWLLVGGRNTMLGAVVGVILVQWLTEWLGGVTAHTPLFLGALFVFVVLFFPKGLVPWVGSLWERLKLKTKRQEGGGS